jgi:precorrin-8X/cobalt-precorrin-8 methylmutase
MLKARIHELLNPPLSGERIEELSFETIDAQAPSHTFSQKEWPIVRRMIHTTGDFAIMKAVTFSPTAIEAGIAALRKGAPLYVDSNMIRAGLSQMRLQSVSKQYGANSIVCPIADSDVATEAKVLGLPRSVLAVRKSKALLNGAICVFGNAPTALLELNRLMIEEGVRPALVIAAPVGFVHVPESKAEVKQLDVPAIVVEGTRGGSPLAVSIIHALCGLAKGETSPAATTEGFDAIILIGHGSRVPGAAESMEKVSEALQASKRYAYVTTCNMSLMKPNFMETFKRMVDQGAKSVLVLPYFLNEGVHIKCDIPNMMQEVGKDYPDVKLVMGRPLGFDRLLVDLVAKRIAECATLPDVRTLNVPSEGDVVKG